MTCRHCSARVRRCRRFAIVSERPRDVCASCWRKIEKAALQFVEAISGRRFA